MVKACAFSQNHHTPAMNTPLTAGDSMSSREIVPIYTPNRSLGMNQEIYPPHGKILMLLLSLFSVLVLPQLASDPSKVAAQVEAALFQFEHSRPVDKPSEVKRPVLLETLRRNKDLRRQVLFGEITPEMLLYTPIAELRQKYPVNSKEILVAPSRERRVIRLCIAGGLSKVSEEVDERYMDSVNASDPSKVAAQVEAALFKHWGPDETMEPVAYRYSLLITLINNTWNKDLRRQVLLGEITPEMLANMSLAEMQQLNTWPEDDPDILI